MAKKNNDKQKIEKLKELIRRKNDAIKDRCRDLCLELYIKRISYKEFEDAMVDIVYEQEELDELESIAEGK